MFALRSFFGDESWFWLVTTDRNKWSKIRGMIFRNFWSVNGWIYVSAAAFGLFLMHAAAGIVLCTDKLLWPIFTRSWQEFHMCVQYVASVTWISCFVHSIKIGEFWTDVTLPVHAFYFLRSQAWKHSHGSVGPHMSHWFRFVQRSGHRSRSTHFLRNARVLGWVSWAWRVMV